MKLSEWAEKEGIHYQTAWKWFKEGKLPVAATQAPSGMILVEDSPSNNDGGVALYARVSSSDQREDLDRQVGRLATFATGQGLNVSCTVSEIGSGLNGSRRKLKALLANESIATIVVEHRERLARFGSEYIEAALTASGRRILIIEDKEIDDDLVRDVTEVLTSLCARLYGRRSAKRRAKAALACTQTEPTT